MRQGFLGADFEALATLWNRFHPEKYRMDASLLIQNTVGSPTFDWGASCIEMRDDEPIGFVAVKRSPASLYRHPDKDQYHLTALAYDDAETGLESMAYVKRILRNRGASRLVFGEDTRHFWPGCPADCAKLGMFLMVQGFEEGGEVVDLERDLTGYRYEGAVPEGDEFRRLEGRDLPALRSFLSAEFPGRWQYDTLNKVEAEGPGTVFGLLQGGAVRGFALLQDASAKLPIGGAIWRADLGENWAALGPIGVAKDLRGTGHGGALLGRALQQMAEEGARRTIIDWTTLVDFYGKFGFIPTRRYQSLAMTFE
ncbi:GNAT family N-acetyltransferase [bacterium]|nr:MAG: GNAT family N-acetyltransferase [bacterium]